MRENENQAMNMPFTEALLTGTCMHDHFLLVSLLVYKILKQQT